MLTRRWENGGGSFEVCMGFKSSGYLLIMHSGFDIGQVVSSVSAWREAANVWIWTRPAASSRRQP